MGGGCCRGRIGEHGYGRGRKAVEMDREYDGQGGWGTGLATGADGCGCVLTSSTSCSQTHLPPRRDRLATLPVEIIKLILQECDKGDIIRMARVAYRYLQITTPLLYIRISIDEYAAERMFCQRVSPSGRRTGSMDGLC